MPFYTCYSICHDITIIFCIHIHGFKKISHYFSIPNQQGFTFRLTCLRYPIWILPLKVDGGKWIIDHTKRLSCIISPLFYVFEIKPYFYRFVEGGVKSLKNCKTFFILFFSYLYKKIKFMKWRCNSVFFIWKFLFYI